MPCMLALSANAVWSRFSFDAQPVISGLVSIDNDGDVTVIERLSLWDFPQNADVLAFRFVHGLPDIVDLRHQSA